MIDVLIPQIEELQSQGMTVVLKWDGGRASNRCTVVLTNLATGYAWREDCDDIAQGLTQALAHYKAERARRAPV